MINISNIKIKNFKSIKEMNISLLINSAGLEKDVELGGFKYVLNKKYGLSAYNVFFGRNSIGKTSILEALSLVMDLHNNSISEYILKIITDEEVGKLRTISDFLNMHNEKNKLTKQIRDEVFSGKGEYFHKYEAKMANIIKNKFTQLAFDKNKKIEIVLDFIIDETTYELNFSLLNSDINFAFKNKETSKEENSEKIIKLAQDFLVNSITSSGRLTLNDGGFNLEANYKRPNSDDKFMVELALLYIKKIVGFDKLLNLIKLADPAIDDIVFTQSGNNEVLNKIIVNGNNIDVMSLSSGTREFIIMLWIILSNAPIGNSLVMIDEIELSLHKELIDVLKIIMDQLFIKKNIQFIITSHNPLSVFDYTSFKQIYSISTDENHIHKIERLSSKFKNHQNIINRYIQGDLACYPDSELSRNVAGDLIE